MKKETSKKLFKDETKAKFKLIKNENYPQPQKQKPQIKVIAEDLPPAA